MRNDGHTEADALCIITNGDTLEGRQPRENSVPCWLCRTHTFNLNAGCDLPDHYIPIEHRIIQL
jgi:hypothetical protein